MKIYTLLVHTKYNGETQTNILFTGSLNQCRAVKLIARHKEKSFKKSGAMPKEAINTYEIIKGDKLK